MADSDTSLTFTQNSTESTLERQPQSVTPKQTPGSDAARKAEADAAFDRIFPVADGAQPGDAATPARDSNGRFLPKSEQAPLQEVKADHTQEASADPSPKQDAKPAQLDREKAVTALRRAKAPEALIEKLDDETLKWGIELAGQQSNNDRLFQQLKQGTAKAADPDQPGQPVAAQAADTTAFDALSEALALDVDGKNLLGKFAATLRAPFEAHVAGVKQENQSLRSTLGDVLARTARTELKGECPELNSKEGWPRCFERAKSMLTANASQYEGDPVDKLVGALRDAYRIEFHEQIVAREIAKATKSAEKRAPAEVKAPNAAGSRSAMSAHDAAFEAVVVDGLTGDAAKAKTRAYMGA